jgi:hypothetical protein
VLRSRLAVLAAAVIGTSLFACGAAHAQQVCNAASLDGGEVCFYAGPQFSGQEFDLSIPLGEQLPFPTDGNCTDLPTGFGLDGSVTNASTDTLYVLSVSCPDSHAGTLPAAIVVPHFSGNIVAAAKSHAGTHSVRMCGPGLVFNPVELTCSFLQH